MMEQKPIYKLRNENATQGLKDLLSFFPNDIIMAEIGCYAGESTVIFYNSGKIKTLYAIDPWENGYDLNDVASGSDMELVERTFDDNIKGKNIIKLKMDMTKAFDLLPELDVIYIDGNHRYEYVLNDIKLALKKIKPDGIICGHDYDCEQHSGVKKAISEILGKPEKVFCDGSWFINKKNI